MQDINPENITPINTNDTTPLLSNKKSKSNKRKPNTKVPSISLFATQQPSYGNSTTTLAILNLDWSLFDTAHIYKCIESLLLNKDDLKSIRIHLTKDGKRKLDEEAENGPSYIYDKNYKKNETESNDEKENNENIENIDKNDIIRKYLVNKRTYHICILEFTTITEAENIYKNLDGLEIEETDNYFDVRFISSDYIKNNICEDAVCKIEDFSRAVEIKPISNSANLNLYGEDIECDWDDDKKRARFIEGLFSEDEIESDIVDGLIDLSEDEEIRINEKKRGNKIVGKELEKTPVEEKINDKKSGNNKENYEESVKKDKKEIKKEKEVKRSKKRKIKSDALESNLVDQKEDTKFKIDLTDNRFADVLENDDFSIDVTHHLYKNNAGLKEIVREKRKNYKDDE